MHILIDGYHINNQRGIGVYTRNLVQGIAQLKGCDIRMTLATSGKQKGETEAFLQRVNADSIELLQTKSRFIEPIWEQVMLPIIINRCKPDLVHLPANTGPYLFLPKDTPVVLTLHDVYFRMELEKKILRKKNLRQILGVLYRNVIVPRVSKRSTLIITVSDFARKEIKRLLNLQHNEIISIPNALDPKYLTLPRRNGPRNKEIVIISGNAAHKNLERTVTFLTDWLHCNPDWRVSIIGVTKEAATNDKFSYHGSLHAPSIIKILDRSRLLIAPSLYESFGIPCLEAISRGVLIMASEQGAMKEVLGDFATYYDPKSKCALFNALATRLRTDPPSAAEVKQYLDNYSVENQARRTMNAYRQVLNP